MLNKTLDNSLQAIEKQSFIILAIAPISFTCLNTLLLIIIYIRNQGLQIIFPTRISKTIHFNSIMMLLSYLYHRVELHSIQKKNQQINSLRQKKCKKENIVFPEDGGKRKTLFRLSGTRLMSRHLFLSINF